jgi:predicted metal-dependent hydrolase
MMSPHTLLERPPRPFHLDGEVLQVGVRESTKARTSRVIIGPRRPLEVIVPQGVDDDAVDRLLESKRRWIAQKVAASRAIAARPAQLGLERPGTVWLAGKPLPIDLVMTTAPPWTVRTTARIRDGKLLVAQVPLASVEKRAVAGAAIARWYRREARRRVLEVVAREAERFGVCYSAVGIRDPKTRWGSCSRRGNLSFSWRLLLAPPEVLEYVVIHELLHLREPNHTKAFWRLVEAARPGWQEQARWLREHGEELHKYRPEAALPGA